MVTRLVVVIACYLLSSVGILFMWMASTGEFRRLSFTNLFPIVWVLAWCAHLFMCGAWVVDLRLHRVWPILGGFFGFLSFAVVILYSLWKPEVSGSTVSSMDLALSLLLYELLLLSPCVLLGVWLMRFHWRRPPTQA